MSCFPPLYLEYLQIALYNLSPFAHHPSLVESDLAPCLFRDTLFGHQEFLMITLAFPCSLTPSSLANQNRNCPYFPKYSISPSPPICFINEVINKTHFSASSLGDNIINYKFSHHFYAYNSQNLMSILQKSPF